MADKIQYVGTIMMPLFIVMVIVVGLIKKVKVFDVFLEGAKDGLQTVYKLIPTLIGIMTAVEIFSQSGLTDFISEIVSPVTDKIKLPSDLIPYILIRPVSGGGSTALFNDLLSRFGADSVIGRIAAVMAGSTETTFYAISVYYQSVGVKKIRHTVVAAVAADITALIVSIVLVRLIFQS